MSVQATVKLKPSITSVFYELRLTPQGMERRNRWTLSSFTAWSVREMQKAFTSSGQGQPGGEMWFGLTQQWAEYKTRVGAARETGVFTGKMKESVGGEENFTKGESITGVGGRSEAYAEHFAFYSDGREKRPVLPEDNYAADKFQSLYAEVLGSDRV